MWKPNPEPTASSSYARLTAALEVEPISDQAFERFRQFIYEKAGINLAPHKRQLVSSRLQKRLRHYGLQSFDAYIDLLSQPGKESERQQLVDLLTTNETYFYREPAHFEFLMNEILPQCRGKPPRIWSAASSSGEEVYTLAMILAERYGNSDWQILGSDISSKMVTTARQGLYPLDRARHLPADWLNKYCLKGVRAQAGNLLIVPQLKSRVRFEEHNLKLARNDGRQFDIVFLRNVLIYFDLPTKQLVLNGITNSILPGGYLFISHVESLHGIKTSLEPVRPSVFRKSA
ncbi:SAM-dependent methyltransferase [Rhodoferax sp. 4810]|uniref:Chemotaxis protein methyltransferase n=1 Tax=Thiospirillum jenense TaxID=1653858 RepID=A0A839HFE0_9GAMM|nr:CheR family methyltransferase [Thiospirillum jenense]MBB1077100.1 SAM-dependent methyltransferase [Rhodoferax jenense]MBB1127164.1 SAM-dependent methyltransferase [Thiospirillum jenense]